MTHRRRSPNHERRRRPGPSRRPARRVWTVRTTEMETTPCWPVWVTSPPRRRPRPCSEGMRSPAISSPRWTSWVTGTGPMTWATCSPGGRAASRNEVSCGAIVSATDAGSLPASPAMPPTKRNGRTPSRRRGGARAGRRSGRNMGGSVECVPQRRAMRSGAAAGPAGVVRPSAARPVGFGHWCWVLLPAPGAAASGKMSSSRPSRIPDRCMCSSRSRPRPVTSEPCWSSRVPASIPSALQGFELIQADEASSSRREAIIAGSLSTGPVLQVWVADRRHLGDYRVQLVQVSGDDYGLEDLTQYGIAISR